MTRFPIRETHPIVINIQADEPLIQPSVIDSLAEVMLQDSSLVMATAIKEIEDEEEVRDPHVVKVVVDKDAFALYFLFTVLIDLAIFLFQLILSMLIPDGV